MVLAIRVPAEKLLRETTIVGVAVALTFVLFPDKRPEGPKVLRRSELKLWICILSVLSPWVGQGWCLATKMTWRQRALV